MGWEREQQTAEGKQNWTLLLKGACDGKSVLKNHKRVIKIKHLSRKTSSTPYIKPAG